jgi:hypothetical protein
MPSRGAAPAPKRIISPARIGTPASPRKPGVTVCLPLASVFRHNGAVSAILYPIAADAAAALNAPRGRAARERDASRLAGEPVVFAREFAGPVFKSEDAARAAYAGRLDDERPEARAVIAPEDRFCELRPIAQRGRMPFSGVHTVWRLSVGFWKTGQPEAQPRDLPQARKTVRERKGDVPDGETLGELTHQPLRPIKPQQPLDIGLFEVRMPENPARFMPDE